MKTQLAVIVSVLISGVAYADSSKFEGFNVGLGVGYVQPKVEYKDAFSSLEWDKSDWVAQVDTSYSKAMNDKWLIGVGLTFDLNKTDAGKDFDGLGSVNAKLKRHGSIYIQPTYTLDGSSAVFAKIGYHSVHVDATGDPRFWIDDKFSAQGIGYGIGYKKIINENFFAQAEIQIVDYEKKSMTDNTGFHWSYDERTIGGNFTVGYKF